MLGLDDEMVTEECKRYLIKGKHNERLARMLKKEHRKEAFFDWIFVALFYSSLHYFNAFLVYKGLKIPTSHRDNENDGRITLAKNKFCTQKNDYTDAVGDFFEQLFNWSCDSRYKLSSIYLLGDKEIETAFNLLDAIKLTTFNEIGVYPKLKGKKISIETASKGYLGNLIKAREQIG
jgi:hypothetical protein